MKLTTLIDNKQHQKQLLCEHGLSFLLQTEQHTILFDTGQSDKFIVNAQKLGIELAEVDYVVLSHGHYDHTGGLIDFLQLNAKAKVLVHRQAFKQRFSRSTTMIKENGIQWRDSYKDYADRFVLLDHDYQLSDSLSILCAINPQDGYAVINERLVVKKDDGFVPDVFDDELILLVKTQAEPIVLCGCAHTGIVNILHQVKERLAYNQFALVAGGLHLNGADIKQVEHVIEGLKPFTVRQWALNHCTGDLACELFEAVYPNQVVYAGSGLELSI